MFDAVVRVGLDVTFNIFFTLSFLGHCSSLAQRL